MNQYDVIGDIHGHAATLRTLLATLGYTQRDGIPRHPTRQAVFVGDFIDKGPCVRETLQIVRAMVETGAAVATLGNHEYNAIHFHTPGPDGKPLRSHSEENTRQHRTTLDQLALPYPAEWAGWLAWFASLPLYLDLGGLRIVHASWCDASVREVDGRRLTEPSFLATAHQQGTPEYRAVNTLLKGFELTLPAGHYYPDRTGHLRNTIRTRWFGSHLPASAPTYRDLVFPASDIPPPTAVGDAVLWAIPQYDAASTPVIFGHYGLHPESPRCLTPNVACVDYSVASTKGGFLTAYRWSGETTLRDAHFVRQPREPGDN